MTVLAGGPFNVSINNGNIDQFWMADFSELFFASDFIYSIGLLGLSFVLIIPLLGLLYGGVKLLFDIPKTNRAIGLTAISLWAIGVILLVIASTNTASHYATKQMVDEEIVLDEIPSDTLILSSMSNTYSSGWSYEDELFIEDGLIKSNDIVVDVVQSKNDKIRLLVDKSSKGANRREAGDRAENINFNFMLDSNELQIAPFIEMPLEDKFRDQEVEISIALPVGVSIYLDPSSREIIYDIKNVTNTYDGRMMGHHWKMTEAGLECTDCAWIESRAPEADLLEEAERLRMEADIQAEKAEEMRKRAEELQKQTEEVTN